MNKNQIIVPQIMNLGLYDFKLSHSSVQVSDYRTVKNIEIELPIENGGFSYIDDCVYPVENNMLICAKPGQRRKTKAPFVCLYIRIIPDEGYICDRLYSLPDIIKLENKDFFVSLFNEIISAYNKKSDNSSILLQSKIFMLIYSILQIVDKEKNPFSKLNNGNSKAVEDAIRYINKNYMNKITLKNLSKIVHLSPYYFHKIFCEATRTTPYDYILDRRIQKAKQMLAYTNLPIADVAANCGFTDQAYFGKMFKFKTAQTPLKFRKTINEQYP